MAEYDTKAVTIGGVTVTVSKEVGESAGDRVGALLKFIAKWLHAGKPPEGGIDNTLPPAGAPVDPGYGQGHPAPPHAGGKPPGTAGGGERPDNTLPGGPPPHVWLGQHADEIAKAVLKSCFECNTAQPTKK